MTYLELDARANQLARFLARSGVRPADRVGLLLDQPVDNYIGMLAVLKAHAAYVPLDAGFPADRLAYMVEDAAVTLVLTHSWLAERAESLAAQTKVVNLDQVSHLVQLESEDRLSWQPGSTIENLCYVVYTSGSTGRPKGVAIEHASICNFVQVAAEVYGIAADDRVYQGMTIAFDFSVEEIWVPWMVGATLVPRPAGPSLLGDDLHSFLTSRGVTALCCVPTLLATLEDDLPALRFLLVSGESCPQDLVSRWHQPGRRFLNVYGPTEATVTATWAVLHPDRPVTIGTPLPTYKIVVLDPDADRALPPGTLGEIGIAGIGLATGYLNRPEETEHAFVPDFIGIEHNPSGRIYRTGDLGMVNPDGEIEHHGRIDAQVKIRGYRVELAEVESALQQVPGIAQAVVSTYEPTPGVVELAGYYTTKRDQDVDTRAVCRHLRESLPGYMVPAYLEQLTAIPVLVSDKLDRKSLPAPRGSRMLADGAQYQVPAAGTQSLLAGLLAKTLGVERVSADNNFFFDLGANSLLMARFDAAARQQPGMATLSIRDVYRYPTVRLLAAAMDARAAAATGVETQPGAAGLAETVSPGQPGADRRTLAGRGASQRFFLCGVLQLAAFIGYATLDALALVAGFNWATSGHGPLGVYVRLTLAGAGLLLAAGSLPIIAKWLLIGRWKPQSLPVWSLAYFRFWLVKTLIITSPVARLSVGTPVYGLYLRALGAKVGPRALVLTKHVPVCTDLLTIGAGSVVRKDSYLNGYRARAGQIETGPITIGAGAFVGEQTVLDIDSAIGAGGQLGHSSALHAGQLIPAGQVWHGSPAEPAGAGCSYMTVEAARCGRMRRASYAAIQLMVMLAIVAPAAVGLESAEASHPRLLARLLPVRQYVTSWTFDRGLLAIAAAAIVGLVLGAMLVVSTVLRLAGRALEPGHAYPLYGCRYTLQRGVARLTNIPLLAALFGDSSVIVHYLTAVGYRLRPILQTGSNFGMAVKHEMPALTAVGAGTIVSDRLSIMNAEFSSTSFRVRQAAIGARNFLGNGIAYPAGGRTGDDCLLATKVMIPVAGPVRTGTGLLGSPCFEIPRTVWRDRQFEQLNRAAHQRQGLAAKNRHNAVTIGLHLLVRYLYVLGLLLVAFCPAWAWGWPDWASTLVAVVVILLFTVVFFVLVERIVTTFRPLRSALCSIYQPEFWHHERYWKVPATSYIQMFNGTAAKSVIWRMLGVRIGRRVFDDGCKIAERPLARIGDACTLNAGSHLHSHSMEDGVFKADYVSIGAGVTIGTAAFVHYGVSMGDDSELDPDAFLMKGEYVPPGARWRGNPAVQVQSVGRRELPLRGWPGTETG